MIDIMIIGGGASGMMAAIACGRENRTSGKKIMLLEQKDRLGKKVLATGNGKCNFTNAHMELSCFYGDPSFIAEVYRHLPLTDTLNLFHELGVLPKERKGYYYPNSEQAASVVWALETEIRRLGVEICVKSKVKEIRRTTKGFQIRTEKDSFLCKKLILACGLKASPKLGSDGSLLETVSSLGHKIRPVVPSLCGFYCQGLDFGKASGVRTDAIVTLMSQGKVLGEDSGELQLTDYGISGIPVFQISHPASVLLHQKKKCQVILDFLPDMNEKTIYAELSDRSKKYPNFGVEALFMGILPQKLIAPLFQKCGITMDTKINRLNADTIADLSGIVKACRIELLKPRDFEFAQVCAGGADTREIDPNTMQSRLVPGLYFTGELVDVDGICGGYNLQWAWSSGYTAGKHAAISK